MKKIALFIFCLNILILSFADTIRIPTYSLDDFLRDNPEYIPETIMVNARLPELQLNNPIVNIIMKNDLLQKLKSYKSSGKILLWLAKYTYGSNCAYIFDPVTPAQSTRIDIVNDSIPTIIGFAKYDEVYVLLDSSFCHQVKQVEGNDHNFRLKILKQITDLRGCWEYISDDSAIYIYYSPDRPNDDYFWRPQIIDMMKRMDEHDF